MAYKQPSPTAVSDGGTGASTLTGVLTGNGTSPITANTITQYDVLVAGASNAVNSIGPGTAGQVLQSGGNAANPAYSTATYPSTATSTGKLLRADGTNWSPTTATYPATATSAGKVLTADGTNWVASTATYPSTAGSVGTILRSDGTNWVATTTTYPNTNAINTLLYASSANVMSALATANSAILNTNSSGVPSLATSPGCSGTLTAGTGLTATTGNVAITAGNLTLPNTNSGGTQGVITLGGNRFFSNFGTQNVFVGQGAGNTSNSGSGNGAFGWNSLISLTSGGGNFCFGSPSGQNITTGSSNIGIGYNSLNTITTTNNNVALGQYSIQNLTGSNNTAVGYGSLGNGSGAGSDNTMMGFNAGSSLTTGIFNVAIGESSMFYTTTGEYNTSLGVYTANNITTGSHNIAVGDSAGYQWTNGAESNNIAIGHVGVANDQNVLRIGTAGTGTRQVNSCFIAGINGITVTGSMVLCSTSGQLGTVPSSERYKSNIRDIDDSISILNLRPRKFNYKVDPKNISYGLVAEEVEKEFPYLCLYNEDGQAESVKYHELPSLLLKEIQRLNARVEKLELYLKKFL